MQTEGCILGESTQDGGKLMREYLTTGLLIAGLCTPALAQEQDANYVVLDTVGVCSVINAEPSAGLKVIGKESGYVDEAAAEKFLLEEAKGSDQCKGIIEPA
jgi:hypothetical protein